MSRLRVWIFTAVVALALAVNLGLLSPRIAQTAEENIRARLTSASSGLRAQLDLLDARLSPRGLGQNVELVEALRPPADGSPLQKPDEKALRAAAAVAAPDPDLLAVANAQGAIVSRRGKPAQVLADAGSLAPLKALLDGGSGAPAFVEIDRQLYRVAGAKVPGGEGAVLTGALIDDRFAAELRSMLDAEVAFFDGGVLAASSLPAGPAQGALQAWEKSPGPGYGRLALRLPLVGRALEGKLPRGTSRLAVRGALLPLDSGVQAAVTVPVASYLGWLARYQAFYLLALALFCLFGLIWGLLPSPQPVAVAAAPQRRASARPGARLDREEPELSPAPAASPVRSRSSEPSVRLDAAASLAAASLASADVSPPKEGISPPVAPGDVPWSHPVEELAGRAEPLDPAMPAQPDHEPPARSALSRAEPVGIAATHDPLWSGDPLSVSGAAFAPPSPEAEESEPELLPEPELSFASEPDLIELPPQTQEETTQPSQESVQPVPADSAPGEFSFAGLLDPRQSAATPEPLPHTHQSLAEGDADRTTPGSPDVALIERSRTGSGGSLEESFSENFFPGDEPTRIQPVSAALLDKLRETDEEASAAPRSAAEAEPAQAPQAPASSPDAAAEPTLHDFTFNRPPEEDPDEAHFQDTFQQFLALREQTGEGAGNASYEKFAAKLRKNREDLLSRHNARGIRFIVYEKDGKAAIKASALR